MLSPKYLRTLRQPDRPAVQIENDRPCRGCGYNLRGLKVGGRCPECGLDIPSNASYPTFDLIGSDEPAMRHRMQWGFLAATVGLGGMIAMRLWMIVPLPRPDHWIIIDIVALVFAIAWCVGVWLITPKELDQYGEPMKSARKAARVLPFGFIVAFLMAALLDSSASPPELAYGAWQIGRVLGGIGVLVVLYLLALPAYDAGRDDVSKWLITAFWGLLFLSPVGVVPRGIAPVEFGWVVYGFLAVFIVAWAILAAIAVACLWALFSTAAWKTGHLSRIGRRDERIREMREEIDRELRERIRPFGDWTPDRDQERTSAP